MTSFARRITSVQNPHKIVQLSLSLSQVASFQKPVFFWLQWIIEVKKYCTTINRSSCFILCNKKIFCLLFRRRNRFNYFYWSRLKFPIFLNLLDPTSKEDHAFFIKYSNLKFKIKNIKFFFMVDSLHL